MAWLVEPSREAAAEFLAAQLPQLSLNRRTLVVVGRCRVDYDGRAESRLDDGDRIVLVKSDGTLLIHNPAGLKPVNWQPPGCSFSFSQADGRLVIEALRQRPRERVRLAFETFALVGIVLLAEGSPLEVKGTEFDIRDALKARPELLEPGFKPWERERLTERGPMDLYGEDAQGRRVIVEVKRTRAGIAEATQLWRYVEKERQKRGVTVRGILVAPAASGRARLLLEEHGLEFHAVDIDRLRQDGSMTQRDNQASLLSFAPNRARATRNVGPKSLK